MKRLQMLVACAVACGMGATSSMYALECPANTNVLTSRMFSSWDRSGGNNDGFSGTYSKLRLENGNSVIAEMKGAGYISRFWITHSEQYPKDGLLGRKREHIKIYLDGSDTPQIDVVLEDIFTGKVPGFPIPLVGQGTGGYFSYVPIFYRNGCKVVIEGDSMRFYQLGYQTLEPSDVPASGLIPAETDKLNAALLESPDPVVGQAVYTTTQRAIAGQPITIALPEANRQLNALRLASDDLPALLKGQIRIYWDDNSTPAIDTPIAHFFAYTAETKPYTSVFTGMTQDGLYNRMPMPYSGCGRVELTFDQPITFTLNLESQACTTTPNARLYTTYHDIPKPIHGKSLSIADVKGRGVYIGTFIDTRSPVLFKDLTLWLEGDEIIYTDGDLAMHGTGTEDYFNCGWYQSSGRLDKPGTYAQHGFSTYFANLTGGESYAAAYRWHYTDPIPFNKQFIFELEHGPVNDISVHYRTTSFYYLNQVVVTPPTVTLKTLLEDMVDLKRIARLETALFTCKQVSSYSRASVAPDKPGWFDNADASQYIRTEQNDGRTEHVLMDETGPGAIVRFWSTFHASNFSNGILRFYLDGQASPTIEGRIGDILGGKQLIGEPLSLSVSQFQENGKIFGGQNLYLPIPYASNCKVTYQPLAQGDTLYYQINYRTYADDVVVEPFTLERLAAQQATLDRVQKSLISPPTAEQSFSNQEGTLAPAETRTVVYTLTDTAFSQISLKVNAVKNADDALRTTILAIDFDDIPCVEVPVGDFFGTGYTLSPYKSLICDVAPDGTMVSRWVMPFQRKATIRLTNTGTMPITFNLALSTTPWTWDESSLYFRANWQHYPNLKTIGGNGNYEVNYITINGKGHYVGDSLTLYNDSNLWWGEGDEKITVDNEAFPSHFGTGTEDYYGYAWCSVVPYSSPFHSQPSGAGNRAPGMSVNNRWRTLDIIPFQKAFHFNMEIWHWASTTMDYAPVCFWYGTATARAVAPKRSVTAMAADPLRRATRIEAESLTFTQQGGRPILTQTFISRDWSGQSQLFWQDVKPDDTLTLNFTSPTAYQGDLAVGFTVAPDYTPVALSVNGQAICDVDLYDTNVRPKRFTLPNVTLKPGANTLTIRIKPSTRAGIKVCGIDYLEPVK